MELEQQITAEAEAPIVEGDGVEVAAPRDYEAEAREMGWKPEDEFPGGANKKFVDAKTFVERGEVFMPFLQKKTKAQQREIDDLKKTIRNAAKHYEGVEERAYKRAFADLEARHADAVEAGDVAGAKRIVGEMRTMEKEAATSAPQAETPDPEQARKELNAWVAEHDWYVLDEKKRAYADLQADLMGPATEWSGGQQAWLGELAKRVDRRFADPKPNPVNGGGNRSAPQAGGRTFNDLPAQARALVDKWHKQGIFGDPAKVSLADARKRYATDYQWD